MSAGGRHCPICGDEIPATAHRLKKLCGKKDCMLEQQRISGRKSYHKVLGHTEPEKKSCMICGDDITHLRGNRVVCEKESCLKERKRRSGYAYFARNQSNLTIVESRRVSAAKYRATKPKKERHCQICRDDISGMPPGATICEKQSCIDYREKLRAQARPQRVKTPRSPKPARPTINKNYQRKPQAHQKPIINKTVKPKRVIADDKPWVPMKPMNLPESMPQYGGIKVTSESSFADPWNCHACRTDQALCRLHQSMEDDGSRPPTFASSSTISR